MSLKVNGKSTKDGAETTLRVDEYGQLTISDSAKPGLPTQYFLTAAGDGTGAYNHTDNYSASPVDFYYQATTQYDIHTALISISDNANFNMLDYGAEAAGTVVNGTKFFISVGGVVEIPLLSGKAMMRNYDWFSITSNVRLSSFAGLSQVLTIVFDLNTEYGKPIILNPGDRFIARLNDDFTGLVSHTFGIRGIKY